MILLCCHKPVEEIATNWDAYTAMGTIALALITLPLAIYAGLQFRDVNIFNKKNENLSRKQSAENIILTQIEFHYKIIERIEKDTRGDFRKIYETFPANFGLALKTELPEMEIQITDAFGKLYDEYGYLLGHYYRNLYRIIKSIHEIEIKDFDKKYYAKLVRAQLSEYEVLLLFYNCIWIGDNKFKILIEEYELLKGINYDKLIDRDRHQNLYLKTAFGDE
jgi:hypothetical protein